jgi:hypothetical protein
MGDGVAAGCARVAATESTNGRPSKKGFSVNSHMKQQPFSSDLVLIEPAWSAMLCRIIGKDVSGRQPIAGNGARTISTTLLVTRIIQHGTSFIVSATPND